MPLPSWATQKLGPIPVWGWGALALGGGVGFILYRRHSSSSTAPTLATGAQAIPSTYPQAPGDAGGAPGGFGPGVPPGGSGSGSDGGTFGPSPTQPVTQPRTTTSLAVAPAVAIAPSLLGGGYIASQGQLQNPAGSAVPTATYTPSLTDYATEQPGGIQTVQAGLPGTQPDQGLTYSIYGTNTGTGPVVPADQRIAGERYDAYGRVIA